MLERIRIRNFKALRDVTLDLTPIHVLIGPNDSGKSSILEAIAALSRLMDLEAGQAFEGLWTGRELVWRGALESTVQFDLLLSDSQGSMEGRVDVRFPESTRSAVVVAESYKGESDEPVHTDGASGYSMLHMNRSEENLLGRINRVLAGAQVYRFDPKHLEIPSSFPAGKRFRMEYSGFGLAVCLDDILSHDRKRFAELEERFLTLFPGIRSIVLRRCRACYQPPSFPSRVSEVADQEGKGIWFELRSGGAAVPASQASDGTLLVLAYLAILYLPSPPRFLLVEEPENGIHPQLLEKVAEIVRETVRTQSETQVVMTTHSPYLLDSFEPEEVTVCHKGEDGAVGVRRLSESAAVQKGRSFFTLGEIWTSSGDAALVSEKSEEYEG